MSPSNEVPERPAPGETRVFFTQNSPTARGWSLNFWNVVKEFGFTPVFYDNVAPGHSSMFKTIGQEMEQDFLNATIVVLYFGRAENGYEDHWALGYLRQIEPSRQNVFLYASDDYPQDLLTAAGWSAEPTVVSSSEDFTAALRRDLSQIASKLNS